MSENNEILQTEEVEKENIVTSQGLDAEQYDVAKPSVEGEKVYEEDGFSGIEIKYDLKGDDVRKALKIFQKRTIYKKNLIYTVVLIILFALYIRQMFNDPANNMAKIMAPLCVAIICFIWYTPKKHIKKMAEGADLSTDIFTIEICEEGILLKEEKGKFLVSYNKPTTKCIELDTVFVIFVSDKQIFAVPKRCIEEEKIEKVRTLLKDGLKEKYEVIIQEEK